jgi:TRAP-type transport system periplasmic protein
MMRRGLLLVCVILLGMVVSVSAAATNEEQENYELTIASLEPVGAPTTNSVEYMAELVAERSGGRLKINTNPGGTLGTGLQIMEGVSLGTIDMASMVLEWYAPFVDDINVYVMGFTFRDGDHFRKFLDSSIFEDMKNQVLDKMNVRIIANNWIGLPRVMVSKFPVNSPEDIQNIKMRVPEIETYLKVWKGLGTSPTRIAWPEVYLALKTGTVDAAEGPFDQMYATKFYEAAPFITLTNHLQQVFTVSINEDVYSKLPKDLVTILEEAAVDAGVWHQKMLAEQFLSDKEKMISEGTTISEIDTKPFQAMLKPVIQDSEDTGFWSKGLYQKIQDIK